MAKKRVVIIADMHCGHIVGLTPPLWQNQSSNKKINQIQKQLWNAYIGILKSLYPIDICFVNGDCVDGKGHRSGSTELITADRIEQCAMAKECIMTVGAEHIVMTYGTPYHTGINEDWEKQIADSVGADKIGGQEWVNVNGVVFDLKHKVGSTTVPYSKGTAISKERLWNFLWTEHEEQPRADVIIRSHVHYFFYCGEESWLGITTPALQGHGTKFGARQCSGHVDFGLIHFDIEDNGAYSWEPHIVRVALQKGKTITL